MKKLLSTILCGALILTGLTACGSKNKDKLANAFTVIQKSSSEETSSSKESSVEEKILKIGASPSPHGEILEEAKKILADKGVILEIIEFTDYVLPNIALDNGDIDANYFQHKPYMNQFNEENGTKIAAVAPIHFEPLGVYPGKSSDLENIPEGAVISLPNDATNEARSLLLLESLGIIKLKEGTGLNATPIDIVENPKNIEFFEIESAQLAGTLADVDFAVINGNYAVDSGILDKLIVTEDKEGEACAEYANYVCVKEGSENNHLVKELVAVLQSDEIKNFIIERYNNLFVPAY